MRGVSGVALAVAIPLVGIGQQPGWVQDVPWIQTASVDVLSGSGYRMASLLQFNHPNGWSWLAAVVRFNRPAEEEISANMLTLTSAQTELSLSIRMNL